MVSKLVIASAACVAIAFLSISSSTASAQARPVFWTMPDLAVAAYSNGVVVSAVADERSANAPVLQRWELNGDRLRAVTLSAYGCTSRPNLAECSIGVVPPAVVVQMKLPPIAPGRYILEVTNYDGQLVSPNQSRNLMVAAAPPTVVITSVGARPGGKFFITASVADVSALTALEDLIGPLWAIAEPITLRAWPAAGPAPEAAKEVCRLFHPMAQTHFFSGNPADCAAIRNTAPWRDDGIAFRAVLPAAGGVCPIGTEPVWRLFSSKFTTHRYTRSSTTYAAFQADGWSGEGVVFCSAPA